MTLYDFAEYVARNSRAGVPATINKPLGLAEAKAAAHHMIESGGSFAAHIGRAYLVADSHNAEQLVKAFPELFKKHARQH